MVAPEAGDAGKPFVLEELLQGVEFHQGRLALHDTDAAGLDFEPLEGNALDELGHGTRAFQKYFITFSTAASCSKITPFSQ